MQYEIIDISDGYRVRQVLGGELRSWVADFAYLEDAELFVKIKRINDILAS